MKKEILNRKGARKASEVPKDVLKLLNSGEIETVNLMEWLAIDHAQLIKKNFENIGISKKITNEILLELKNQKKTSTMNSVKLIGSLIHENYADTKKHESIFQKLCAHPSDSIRCYGPYLIAQNQALTIQEKLDKAKSLVADHHFGIREVVWMALRPEIAKNLKVSIKLLSTWTDSEDENIRRFTTEATRPRGVWCKHIDELKENPQLAISILKKLKSDPSKYVQDSVGNWLNDASKTAPEFVIALCDKWIKLSPTKETEKIIKRAKRTIDKK